MKKILFGLLFIFLMMPITYGSCGLGATPLSVTSRALPGQTVKVTWNLYNLYGDRNTHVTVTTTNIDGWEVTIDPIAHQATYLVSGVEKTVTENLAVPARPAIEISPAVDTEGYVKHPFNNKYIPVVPVTMYIDVPEGLQPWETYTFIATASGNCFSTETGTLSTNIAQQLKITVQTITEEYYEEFVWDRPWYVTYLPVMITGFVLILVVVLLLLRPMLFKKIKSSKKRVK